MNIPYLSAETVLAKLNETAKLKEQLKEQMARQTEQMARQTEEIGRLREIIQGTASKTETEAFWVIQLQKDGDGFKEMGAAFQVKGDLQNVDDLKKAIDPSMSSLQASKITIYSKNQDAEWVEEEPDAEINSGASKTDCYGFTLPSA